ncbi:MAG: single-stranded DNA-binding protein [Lawsonibacter sp.]|jgi:single-strand DNA-binding protein
MRQTAADLNRVLLHGRLGAAPSLSHLNHGVEFYRFPLRVFRLSGTEDQVNVVVPGPLLEAIGPLMPETEVTVLGELRTFNNRTGIGSRLIISVFAREIHYEQGEDINQLELTGTLCKPPSLRSTPLGRTICDLILAVNRRYGRADYLPCIAWGSLAHRCGGLGVGDRVRLSGRLQSRVYNKTLGDRVEERVAFEVSIMSMNLENVGAAR